MIAIVVAAAAGAFLWFASEPAEVAVETLEAVAPLADVAEPVRVVPPTAPKPAPASRDVIVVDLASVPEGAPVAFDLGVPAPPQDVPSLDVRVLSVDRRVFETVGAVASDDRTHASVEVEAGWLTPGRYLVEVKTTERSHFPLRRYVLEVR